MLADEEASSSLEFGYDNATAPPQAALPDGAELDG